MGYLSFNLQLQDKQVVIIGGGTVAQRKTATILPAGARLTVISPDVTDALRQLVDNDAITHIPREYRPGDLESAFLAIAATSNRDVNRAVADEADRLGILIEVVDSPASGNITSPAIFKQGNLCIAISTNNRAPALSAAIRRKLAGIFGPEYAQTVCILGAVREKLLTDEGGSTYNRQVLCELAEQLPHLIASGAGTEIDALLQHHLGPGYTLASIEPALEDPQ